MKRFAIAAALMFGMTVPVGAGEDRVLSFPTDYRQNFTLYYSGDRYLAEEQTIKLFANDVALAAAQKGEKLPDGSVLVAEIYAAQKDGDGEVLESAIGRRLPGEFKAIALMERKSGWDAQYSDDLKVGDWEFELFNTAGKNLNKDTTGCRQCHAPLGDSDYLFSIEHMAAVK